jgi:hypothetical protein
MAFLFGHDELDAMGWIIAPRIWDTARAGRSLEMRGLASQPHLDERDQQTDLSTTKPLVKITLLIAQQLFGEVLSLLEKGLGCTLA